MKWLHSVYAFCYSFYKLEPWTFRSQTVRLYACTRAALLAIPSICFVIIVCTYWVILIIYINHVAVYYVEILEYFSDIVCFWTVGYLNHLISATMRGDTCFLCRLAVKLVWMEKSRYTDTVIGFEVTRAMLLKMHQHRFMSETSLFNKVVSSPMEHYVFMLIYTCNCKCLPFMKNHLFLWMSNHYRSWVIIHDSIFMFF